jgi:antitoxin VapB
MARTTKDDTPAALAASKPRETPLFRYCGGQAVRIPPEFELPGDRVLIWRDGPRLIIEPVAAQPHQPRDLSELLAKWRCEGPLGPEDELPEIPDPPVQPEDPLN